MANYTQIQLRRDTTTNWSTANPILAEGEFTYDITANKVKIGDGITNWNSLPYAELALSAYEVAVENGFIGTEQEWTNNFFYEYFVIPLGFPDIDAQLSTDVELLGEYFPFDFTIQTIILTLTTAPTGSNFIVNIKKNGVSIFNTLLSVDAGEKTSVTATTPYVLNTNIINQGDLLSFSVTQVGATVRGQYPVIVINGVRI